MHRPFELHNAPPITLELKYGMTKLSKNGKKYPTKLNHFLVVTRERGEMNFKIAQDVHDKLGETTPKSVPIRLMSDSPSECFALFRAMFSNKGVLGCGSSYGDRKAMRYFKGEGKSFEFVSPYEVECSETCEFWKNAKCDISGILYFRLSDELPRSGSLGAIRINGTHAQRRVRTALEIIQKQTGGILANIPLRVTIHQEAKRAADGATYPIPMLSIEPEGGQEGLFLNLEKELMRRRRVMELTGSDNLFMYGVLDSVNKRDAINDSMEMEPSSEEPPVMEVEEEVETTAIPEHINKMMSSMPERKVEIIINKYTDPSTGKIDEEGLVAYLKKENERSKTPPKKNNDIDF